MINKKREFYPVATVSWYIKDNYKHLTTSQTTYKDTTIKGIKGKVKKVEVHKTVQPLGDTETWLLQ